MKSNYSHKIVILPSPQQLENVIFRLSNSPNFGERSQRRHLWPQRRVWVKIRHKTRARHKRPKLLLIHTPSSNSQNGRPILSHWFTKRPRKTGWFWSPFWETTIRTSVPWFLTPPPFLCCLNWLSLTQWEGSELAVGGLWNRRKVSQVSYTIKSF